MLLALKRHDELSEEIIGLLINITKEDLDELFKNELRRYLPAGYGFFKMTHQFLKILLKNEVLSEQFNVSLFQIA